MPRLILTDQDRKQTIELKDKLITIGRAPDNAIVLQDDSISSYHAVLKAKDGNYSLQDLDSTNGMKVDGRRVKSADLEDGTELKLGDVVGTYESEVPVTKKSTPPPPSINSDFAEKKGASESEKDSGGKPSKSRGGRKEADLPNPKSDKALKTPPPAVKRSKQIAQPKKVKKGGCGLLVFTFFALAAPFAGMTIRHYQETSEWLPVQIWEKMAGGSEEEDAATEK